MNRLRPVWPLAALAFAGLVMGCADNGPSGASDTGQRDIGDCHYDCFGGTTCMDGVFISSGRSAIPCGPFLDAARSSPYGICNHYGDKTPCVSGLCTQGICSDDHDLLEDLAGPDAAPTPCDVGVSAFVGQALTLTIGPDNAPLVVVADLEPAAFTPAADLTLTLVATPRSASVTLGGDAATTQNITHVTLYGAAALPAMSASGIHPICRGALIATLADGAEVRVVWTTSINCLRTNRPPYQATCRVLHVPAANAR